MALPLSAPTHGTPASAPTHGTPASAPAVAMFAVTCARPSSLAKQSLFVVVVTTDGLIKERSLITEFTSTLSGDHHDGAVPVWAPDGRIGFLTNTSRGTEVQLVDPRTRHTQRTTIDWPVQPALMSWLPDSRHAIVVGSMELNSPRNELLDNTLFMLDVEGGKSSIKPIRLWNRPNESFMHPDVSPDGSKIAVVSNRTGGMRVWTGNMDGSMMRLLSPTILNRTLHVPGIPHPILARVAQKVPTWSPDGSLVAYFEGLPLDYCWDYPAACDAVQASWHVYIANVATGKRHVVAGQHLDNPVWWPDGRVLASADQSLMTQDKFTETTVEMPSLCPPGLRKMSPRISIYHGSEQITLSPSTSAQAAPSANPPTRQYPSGQYQPGQHQPGGQGERPGPQPHPALYHPTGQQHLPGMKATGGPKDPADVPQVMRTLACTLVHYPQLWLRFCGDTSSLDACKWHELMAYISKDSSQKGLIVGCKYPCWGSNPAHAYQLYGSLSAPRLLFSLLLVLLTSPSFEPHGGKLTAAATTIPAVAAARAAPPSSRLSTSPAASSSVAEASEPPPLRSVVLAAAISDYASSIGAALDLDDMEDVLVAHVTPSGIVAFVLLGVILTLTCVCMCVCLVVIRMRRMHAQTEARLRAEYDDKIRRLDPTAATTAGIKLTSSSEMGQQQSSTHRGGADT